MPAELYVNNGCRYSAMAMSMLANAPTTLKENVKVSRINYKNAPPHVTSVPTLITQNGQMLVGSQVFDFLKRGRHDPKFPLTDVDAERFSGAVVGSWAILAAVIVGLYFAWTYDYLNPILLKLGAPFGWQH